VFLHTQIVNQTALVVIANQTDVTKYNNFVRTKTELVFYIGRRRTTSFDENDTRVNKNCKYIMHPTGEETQMPKEMSLLWPTLYICSRSFGQHVMKEQIGLQIMRRIARILSLSLCTAEIVVRRVI